MTALGIILIIYGIAVLAITYWKPEPIWKLAKIQAFIKILTETGTVVFFAVWGIAAIVIGIILLV